MSREIYQLRDALEAFWKWEDMLQETDRDAWKEFQWLTNDLDEAVAGAEEDLTLAEYEAQEYLSRMESLEDELYYANEQINLLSDQLENIRKAVKGEL